MKNIILIASSCGMVAFGFLAYMQAEIILMAQNEVICYADVGFTDIWIVEIGFYYKSLLQGYSYLLQSIRPV